MNTNVLSMKSRGRCKIFINAPNGIGGEFKRKTNLRGGNAQNDEAVVYLKIDRRADETFVNKVYEKCQRVFFIFGLSETKKVFFSRFDWDGREENNAY